MKALSIRLATALFAITVMSAAVAQEAPRRLRASIDAVDGQQVMLTTREGEKIKLVLSPNAAVTALVPAALDAIKPNSYIGTAAMPQPDGTLVALEVHIFTEAQRGAGEGHRPWDGGPNGTNGGNTMTNATVSTVLAAKADARGRMLTLTYPGGDKQVLVPDSVPVVAFAPGDRSLVKPGNHVLVQAVKMADGSYGAERITVGRDGLVPPM